MCPNEWMNTCVVILSACKWTMLYISKYRQEHRYINITTQVIFEDGGLFKYLITSAMKYTLRNRFFFAAAAPVPSNSILVSFNLVYASAVRAFNLRDRGLCLKGYCIHYSCMYMCIIYTSI